MDSSEEAATIAGVAGVLVREDEVGSIWEVSVSPEWLAQVLALCSQGRSLDVVTAGGTYRALARRWWVLSAGSKLLVRVALERSVSA